MNATTYTLTRTAERAAFRNGFTPDDIADCFNNPKAVYASKGKYEGQWRVVNRAVCLAGVPNGDNFHVLTMYANGSSVS